MGMKLGRLELDFARRRASAPWAGRVLLAAALLVCADIGASYHQLRRAIDVNGAKLARLAPASAAPAAPVSPEEMALAHETVERLALPWDRLFAALEAAASDDVALAGIEPDLKSGTVLISGHGKDYLAALGYVLRLSRDEALGNVHLVRHEAKGASARGPVSFGVSAAWKTPERAGR